MSVFTLLTLLFTEPSNPDLYQTWTGVHGPPHGPGPWTTMDHSMDPVHGPGTWTTPWTTPNFQKEIAPVNMKIYRRSGFEKHRLVSIAYVLEGLSRISGLLWD